MSDSPYRTPATPVEPKPPCPMCVPGPPEANFVAERLCERHMRDCIMQWQSANVGSSGGGKQ